MEESPGQPARLCSAKFERATQATILCRKRLWRKSFEHPTSRAVPAPSARPQAGIPFGIGSLLHRVSIEVRRSIGPPHWTALAQFSLDDIDRAMRAASSIWLPASLAVRTELRAFINSLTKAAFFAG